jgi:hypothetical protein
VAHQLEVTVQEIEQFKRQNDLVSDEEPADSTITRDYPEEIDLRAEDDALIAAELEAAEIEAERAKAEAEAAAKTAEEGEDREEPRSRRRSRRGGTRGRRSVAARGRSPAASGGARSAGPLEGTFDHGEEGYGLWLDPAIQDDPIYAEYWAGHRPVEVVVEEDQIVIRRVGEDD